VSFAHRYRVDNVPWYFYPPYILWSWVAGIFIYLYFLVVRVSSKIELTPADRFAALTTPGQAHILACWHENTWSLICCLFPFPGHVWMNHPYWYMKPIHVGLKFCRVERYILGSSSYRGREAADELVVALRNGKATAILPDGPDGPPKVLKKGILFIAAASGAPIYCVQVFPRRFIRLRSWDRKLFPLPFNSFRLTISEPIYVSADNPKGTEAQVVAALSVAAK
jgi:lysophospholipid acyltransferase (LPLAT)-like uncharacterized protein